MTKVLRIVEREYYPEERSWSVEVKFKDSCYDVQLRNSFSDAEESNLEWYFEQYLQFPVVDTFKAKNVVESLATYGKDLFCQIFPSDSGDSPRSQYRLMRDVLLPSQTSIEIVGASQFQCIHWELLRDPSHSDDDDKGLLALTFNIIRRPRATALSIEPTPGPNQAVLSAVLNERASSPVPSPRINILLVVARPAGVNDAEFHVISRPLFDILEDIRRYKNIVIRFDIVRPGSFKSLKEQLAFAHRQEYTYHIIHFDVHGMVEDHNGQLE